MSKCDKCLLEFADVDDDVTSSLAVELMEAKQENERLRAIVEFFYDQLQMHSPKMDGKSTWRFRHGWPMTHCIGPTREKAVEAAMGEIDRNRNNQKGEEE